MNAGALVSCHRWRLWSKLDGISLTEHYHLVQFQFKFQLLMFGKCVPQKIVQVLGMMSVQFHISNELLSHAKKYTKHNEIESRHQYQCSTSVLVKWWIMQKKTRSFMYEIKRSKFFIKYQIRYQLPVMHLNDFMKWKLWIQHVKGQREMKIDKKMRNSLLFSFFPFHKMENVNGTHRNGFWFCNQIYLLHHSSVQCEFCWEKYNNYVFKINRRQK